MTIRVAQVMGQMNGGGVEAVVMNYYRHIDRERVQFDLIVDENSEMIPRDEVESMGGRVFLVPPLKSLKSHETALEKLYDTERWEIVHSHRNTLSFFPLRAAKRLGVPVRIAHSHSTSGKGEHAKNVAKGVLRRFSNVYPTHRFACSRYAGEWLFGKGAEFEVLYNAIELERFYFDVEVRRQARAALGLVGDTFTVGHVGRFMTQKNHGFLVDAFAELVKLRPDSVLLLVGSGETRASVERLVAERGLTDKVRFLGQRSDVGRLYQAMDAFALPSLYEGLCLVGVEAQAAGLPCFLSDTITREVDVTGTVRFLPIDDPRVWAEALSALVRAETGRFAVNRTAFSVYNIELQGEWMTKKYLELQEEASL